MDHDERVQFGNDLVRSGWLAEMRKQTGVSLNTVAGWLKSNSHHVGRWERGDVAWVQARSALRIADLCDAHRAANEWLDENGPMDWSEITPLRSAAANLGIAVSTLRSRLNQINTDSIDLGMLGEWIEYTMAKKCRR